MQLDARRFVHDRRTFGAVLTVLLLAATATAAVTVPARVGARVGGRSVPVTVRRLAPPRLARVPTTDAVHARSYGEEIERQPTGKVAATGARVRAPQTVTVTPASAAAGPDQAGAPGGSAQFANAGVTAGTGTGAVATLRRVPGVDNNANVPYYGGGWEPPDPAVAVSPDYVVELVNSVGRVTVRSTLATTPMDLSRMFSSDPSTAVDVTDPRVLWDGATSRWFASVAVYTGDPNAPGASVVLAVSTSANPLDPWRLYDVEASDTVFNDQPRLGLTADKVVMSWDGYPPDDWEHSELGVIDKAAVVAGSASPAIAKAEDTTGSDDWYGITPAIQPPTGAGTAPVTRGYAAYNWGGVAGVLTIDGPVSALQVTDTPMAIGALTTNMLTASQPTAIANGHTYNTLDAGDTRFQSAAVSGDRMWVAGNSRCQPAGDTTLRTCLRLIQLDVSAAPRVVQDVDAGQKGLDLAYPAVALDPALNLVASYSFSSFQTFASLGALTQPAAGGPFTSTTLAPGGITYQGGRFGDYGSAVPDPVDPAAIWVVGETEEAHNGLGYSSNWTTAVVQVTLAAPAVTGVSPAAGLPAGGDTVTISGQHFLAGATSVTFGGVPATAVTVKSPERLTAIVPAGPVSVVDVQVQTAFGPSPVSPSARYTYQGADLRASLVAAQPSVTVGDDVTFTVTAANAGPLPAPTVRVAATVTGPAVVTGASVAGVPCDPSACAVGSLASGASVPVAVSVHTTGAGTAALTATMVADQADPNPADNDATASVMVTAPAPPASVTTTTAPPPASAASGSPGPVAVPEPAPSAPPAPLGYWFVASDGGIFSFGGRSFLGAGAPNGGAPPVVAMAATPSGHGYWVAARDGAVSAFGDAPALGSLAGVLLAQPIVGMAPTPAGHGFWLVASDGGIFSFGDAHFFGSTGDVRLNQPIVGMAATPSGNGYWLVARDGGVFAFGDARFLGSTGDIHLNQPIVGMARTASGGGYWFVASDGGVFAFGDAPFKGSTGSIRLNQPIVGMAPTASGKGYWFVASDGGIFAFGDAPFLGSTGNIRLNQPIVGMA